MAKETKKLYDVVFLSHTCGLNHERIELTDKQANEAKKAVKIAFDETLFFTLVPIISMVHQINLSTSIHKLSTYYQH